MILISTAFKSIYAQNSELIGYSKPIVIFLGVTEKHVGYSNPVSIELGKYIPSNNQNSIIGISNATSITIPVANNETIEIPAKPLHMEELSAPRTSYQSNNTFALIIGNENYSAFQTQLSTEIDVKYAINDASLFKDYAINTLGLPLKNVMYLENATTIAMKRAIEKLSLISKVKEGEASIIFFYAGHGLPDENTKEPYLIPVDVTGQDIKYGIKLIELYQTLTKYPAKQIVCFIDACFSGGARSQGLLATRGVRVVPKQQDFGGNLAVLSASSSNQSALPLEEKSHGIFSYYLLKKLNETNGDISLKELSDYVIKEV
ncbi:MAG: caspase domain-containing protein [Salinivirgaceae bacterium]